MPAVDLLPGPKRSRRRAAGLITGMMLVCGVFLVGTQPGNRVLAFLFPASPSSSAPLGSEGRAEPAPERQTRTHELRTERLSVFLAEIAEEAGRGLVIAPQVDIEISAVLFGPESWEQRLDEFSRTYGFDYVLRDSVIEVHERPPARTEPSGHEAPPVAATAEAPRVAIVEVVALEQANAGELVSVIEPAVKSLGIGVVAEPVSNSLVLTGASDGVAASKRLVTTLDVARRVFMLEARIVEVSTNAREELGVEWALQGDVGATVNFPVSDVGGDGASLLAKLDGSPAFLARISALEAAGDARVISRPRLLIREGRSATIESVRILRVRLPDRTALLAEEDGLAPADGPARAVEAIPVGLSLRVEPVWQGNGRILIKIRAKSSALGPPLPPDGIPEEFSRVVEAEVVVADGETAVLGGLLRDGVSRSGSGVPGLRALPLVGRVFGSSRDDSESEELIFMVTPKLVG